MTIYCPSNVFSSFFIVQVQLNRHVGDDIPPLHGECCMYSIAEFVSQAVEALLQAHCHPLVFIVGHQLPPVAFYFVLEFIAVPDSSRHQVG